MSEVDLPPIEGLTWSVRPRQYGLHVASRPDCMVARLTHLESVGWLVWLDFDTVGTTSGMLYRADAEQAIAETVAWATTYRERLARGEHSGCPHRVEPMPVPRRGKRSARRRPPL